MPFLLDEVIPWGRGFDEYVAMFSLTFQDLRRRTLGCGDGPAAFNAVANRTGGGVVSVDPLYEFSAEQVRERIDNVFDQVLAETERNRDEFVWSTITSVAELGERRRRVMEEFLSDYPTGVREHRYVSGALPDMPFMDQTFELALCSHFLFLYSAHRDLVFHLASIKELCRVAEEVRIFPILELGGKKSRHLSAVLTWLERENYAAELVTVNYEFQKGGNQMLRIVHK
jgi:hypothetical protein